MRRAGKPPLGDTQAHDRLCAAREALGEEPGATVRANTALEAARRALTLLQIGLVLAMERNEDRIQGVLPPGEDDAPD